MKKRLFWELILITCFVFIANVTIFAQTKCAVIYTNCNGMISTDYYNKLACKVDAGTTIRLPNYSKDGYYCYWKNKKTNKNYKPGAKVTITEQTTFMLFRKKYYTLVLKDIDGGKLSSNSKYRIYEGEKFCLPSYSKSQFEATGWSATKNNETAKYKFNQQIKMPDHNVVLYLSGKTYKYKLCYSDGRVYKIIRGGTHEKFPYVSLRNDATLLGWSTQKDQHSNPKYTCGSKIPTSSSVYYMVSYLRNDEVEVHPSQLKKVRKYQKVYLVGDSRINHIRLQMGSDLKDFSLICKSGTGFDWFSREISGDDSALYQLLTQLQRDYRVLKGKKAIVLAHGVNDLRKYDKYISYYNHISSLLKSYNCDLYFLSVNPIDYKSYTLRHPNAKHLSKSPDNILTFNRQMKERLNRDYSYIDTYSYLKKTGFATLIQKDGYQDGLHYTKATNQRLINYIIAWLNK